MVDLDGDGADDVITSGEDTVTVWANDGDGVFSPTEYPTGGSTALDPIVVDVNGDSTLDVLLNDLSPRSIRVLEGTGSGEFAPGVAVISGNDMASPEVGQFGGDAKPDIAVLDYIAEEIDVYLQAADGTFDKEWTIPTGERPQRVVSGDLDGDGLHDLVMINADDDELAVTRQQSAGGFGPLSTYAVGDEPVNVELVDIDGDLALDAVTVDQGDESLSILHGTGHGGFAARSTHQVGPYGYTILTSDFDDDGDEDLIAPGASSGSVPMLLQADDGSFERVDAGSMEGGGYTAAIGDLDGDDEEDLVMGRQDRWFVHYGDVLAMEPYELSFADVVGGFSEIRDLRVRNTGSSAVSVGEVALDDESDLFVIEADQCAGVVLDVRQTCAVTIRFDSPVLDESDAFEAYVDVEGDSSTGPRFARLWAYSYQPPLWAEGFLVPELPSVTFGRTARTSVSAARTVPFWNAGDTAVTLTAASATDGFKIVADGCGNLVLGPSESCQVGVAFAPGATTPASATGTLSVGATEPSAGATVALKGVTSVLPRLPRTPWVRPPLAPARPVDAEAVLGRALDRLIRAVPGLVRGGPRRALRLPAFTADRSGRLSIALSVRRGGKRLKLAEAGTVVGASKARRLRFSLNRPGRSLLGRSNPMRVQVRVVFRPGNGLPVRVVRARTVRVPAAQR